ncbi:exonuclease domain-containing protein [Vreelandella nanhaiensis]|uniref:Transposase n=1 Tax=Vreelandella nanhaiensis TaxID=1258546 RepID=A0A433KXL9_9GAMM|nr:exonuclease domain-containing protein [Halomonas nanhaiensis]RUR34471.1 transposase [Halomonas nanhaiensis]
MAERFVVIDVETANPDMSSICQVGLAVYEQGRRVETHSLLVDPEDGFDEFNIAIHGITPDLVQGQPTFAAVLPVISRIFSDSVVASYGHFDRAAVAQACRRYGQEPPTTAWLNLHPVVRRAWPEEAATEGVALAKTARRLGVDLLKHHDAEADAIAAGEIFLLAIEASGLGVSDWLQCVTAPIRPGQGYERHVSTYEVSTEGALHGEGIVFTGALSMTREQAREAAAKLGCVPLGGVSKKTTMLVVGDQDLKRLVGADKSSKHRKAEELISKGQTIRILGESDFISMLKPLLSGSP